MKPTHQTAALPPLNLVAEMKKGITDRGDFRFQVSKEGGFAQVTFNAPPQQFKSHRLRRFGPPTPSAKRSCCGTGRKRP